MPFVRIVYRIEVPGKGLSEVFVDTVPSLGDESYTEIGGKSFLGQDSKIQRIMDEIARFATHDERATAKIEEVWGCVEE